MRWAGRQPGVLPILSPNSSGWICAESQSLRANRANFGFLINSLASDYLAAANSARRRGSVHELITSAGLHESSFCIRSA